MPQSGGNKVCHVCHHAETLPNDAVCHACHDYLSPGPHYGRWDSPEPADSLSQAGGGQHELSEANLRQHLGTFQSRTETALVQRRAEMRASYRQMLHQRQVEHKDDRDRALIYARGSHEQSDILASVAASEEAEYRQGAREDARCQTALSYRQLLRHRMESTREPRDKALPWVRYQLRDEADILSIAASEEQEYQGDISNNRETLLQSYHRLLRSYTQGNRHSRTESLELGRRQLGHHPSFVQVVAQEEEEYQDYLRDEERAKLRQRYRFELHNLMENYQYTREQALARLQEYMSHEDGFAEIARSEQGDYEGQRRIETAGGLS